MLKIQSVQASDNEPNGSNTTSNTGNATEKYVLNTSSKRFHLPGCSSAASMDQSNRQDYTGDRQTLIDQGYTPCGICKP